MSLFCQALFNRPTDVSVDSPTGWPILSLVHWGIKQLVGSLAGIPTGWLVNWFLGSSVCLSNNSYSDFRNSLCTNRCFGADTGEHLSLPTDRCTDGYIGTTKKSVSAQEWYCYSDSSRLKSGNRSGINLVCGSRVLLPRTSGQWWSGLADTGGPNWRTAVFELADSGGPTSGQWWTN